MSEHKTKMVLAKKQGNIKGVIEVLLSLRVNALQISPELRKNLVYELIRNDIFLLNSSYQDKFVLDLFTDLDRYPLIHATISLISVIVSTLKGVQYIMSNGKELLITLIKLTKHLALNQKRGFAPKATSVNLRFCMAIL